MSTFSGKQNASGWLSLAGGMIQKPKESPRLVAMQRVRAKRAAKARAAAGAYLEEEPQQEDQKPIKLEVHQDYAPSLQPPPPRPPPHSNQSLALAPSPPPSNQVLAPPPQQPRPAESRVVRLRKPTHTLQLLPVTTPIYRSTVIGVRRAWVTRVDGEKMSGWLRWSVTLDDVVITCDCHNLMFSPEGFLNHAGLKGMSMDRPLRHIMVFKSPPADQE